jgi:hypothetical protein
MATLISNMVGDTTNGAAAKANRKAKGSARADRIRTNIGNSARARGARDGARFRNDARNERNAQARADRATRIRTNIGNSARARGARDARTNFNPSL